MTGSSMMDSTDGKVANFNSKGFIVVGMINDKAKDLKRFIL